jgi:hypothetical protein
MTNTLNILLKKGQQYTLGNDAHLSTYVTFTLKARNSTLPVQTSKQASGKNPDYENQEFSFQLGDDVTIDSCTLIMTVYEHKLLFKDPVIGDRKVELAPWKENLADKKTLGLTVALNNASRGLLQLNLAWNADVQKELQEAESARLFTNQMEEMINPTSLNIISGAVPEWLNGVMLSQISGQWAFGTDELVHLFDGPSMINKFDIHNQQIDYQSRFLVSNYRDESNEYDTLRYINFGQTPNQLMRSAPSTSFASEATDLSGVVHSLISASTIEDTCEVSNISNDTETISIPVYPEKTNTLHSVKRSLLHQPDYEDYNKNVNLKFNKTSGLLMGAYGQNANVTIDVLGSKPNLIPVATTDTPYSAQFNLETLETIQQPVIWEGDSVGYAILSPSHSGYNPKTKEYYNVVTCLTIGLPPFKYKLVKYNDKSRTIIGTLPAEMFPKFFHSFGLSDNYMILIMQPFGVNA